MIGGMKNKSRAAVEGKSMAARLCLYRKLQISSHLQWIWILKCFLLPDPILFRWICPW